jgi:hypothetical protein
MTDWEVTLEQRNAKALKMWRVHMNLVRAYGVAVFPDARRPRERDYFEFAMGRKLEVARSFLDRLHYNRQR